MLKKLMLVVDGGGGRRWSGASSGTGAESRRKKCLLLWVGGGQLLGTLLHKLKWRCLVVCGTWLFSLENYRNSYLEANSKFQQTFRNMSSLLVLPCSY